MLNKNLKVLWKFENEYLGLSHATTTEGIYVAEATNSLRMGDLLHGSDNRLKRIIGRLPGEGVRGEGNAPGQLPG